MIERGNSLVIYGRNGVVGATDEPIWNVAGALPTLLTAAEQLKVKSSHAQDDADITGTAGTGVWTVIVEGVDSGYRAIQETVTMNGATAVTTTASFLRVTRVYVNTVGAGLVAAGNITVNDNADSVTFAKIDAGQNQSYQAIYTVPATKTLSITAIEFGELETKDTNITLYIKETGSNKPWRQIFSSKVLDGSKTVNFDRPKEIKEKTDVYLAARSAGGSGIVTGSIIGFVN